MDMLSILSEELRSAQARLDGQRKVVAESEKGLEAARQVNLRKLETQIETRLKRQRDACRTTEVLVDEIEHQIEQLRAKGPQIDVGTTAQPKRR